MISRILLSSLCVALTLSKPVMRPMLVQERLHDVPSGFTLEGPASADSMLTLRLGLVQSDPQGLIHALYDVSTPGSVRYGKYLTKEQAAQYAAPSAASVSKVTAWLTAHGVSAASITPAGDWLSMQVPVSKANEMLGTEFHVFTSATTGKQTIRTLEYSIPAELSGHLDVVHPTVAFQAGHISAPRVLSAAIDTDNSCADLITPTCLQALYKIPTTPASEPSNSLAVTGYQDQWPLKTDLKLFLEQFRPDMSPNTTFNLTTLDGGSDPQEIYDAGTEASLDVQYAVGLATAVPIEFISVGDETSDGELEGWLDTVDYLLTLDSPPQVVATSYGANEDTIPEKLAIKYCYAAAQLGARGVSMLFASGDGGVAGGQSQDCTAFVPVFPATCPYITSVGATEGLPEVAAEFSTGGFSNYFSVADYQSEAVSAYLGVLDTTHAGLYNTTGRGFPDVATQGANFQIVVSELPEEQTGTSASAPTFASIVALLNDRLLAAGKPVLGFLNPWLYSTVVAAGALNNITSGSNPGCGTPGFPAAAGWNPVSGLGTPDFEKLAAAAGL